MKKTDVEIGGEYKISGGYNGRAKVTGPAEKRDKWSNVYVFPVEYPDSIDENGNPKTAKVEVRSIIRPWTEEDEDRWQHQMEEGAKIDAIKDKLVAAGFEPYQVRFLGADRGMIISFLSPEADRLVESLTKVEEAAER